MPVEPGDEVVIIGSQGDERIDVREIAAAIGTNPVRDPLPHRDPDRADL